MDATYSVTFKDIVHKPAPIGTMLNWLPLYRFKPREKVLQHVNNKSDDLRVSNAMITIAGYTLKEIVDLEELMPGERYVIDGKWTPRNGKCFFVPKRLLHCSWSIEQVEKEKNWDEEEITKLENHRGRLKLKDFHVDVTKFIHLLRPASWGSNGRRVISFEQLLDCVNYSKPFIDPLSMLAKEEDVLERLCSLKDFPTLGDELEPATDPNRACQHCDFLNTEDICDNRGKIDKPKEVVCKKFEPRTRVMP